MSTEYHIVHIDSVKKVAAGQKPAELEQRRKAQYVLDLLKEIMKGNRVVFIDNPSVLTHPPKPGIKVKVGGAFVGQCLEEYTHTLQKHNIDFELDPQLSLQ